MLVGRMLMAAIVILTIFPPPVVAAPACDAEDDSAGVGGQDVDCTFECEKGNLLSLEVEAADHDADVSGTVKCGGQRAHCTGAKTCTDTTLPSATGGSGACEWHSSEAWDSGLYVKCSADGRVGPPGLPPIPCLPAICANPDVPNYLSAPPLEKLCVLGGRAKVNPELDCPTAAILTVHLWISEGQASALRCDEEACVPVPALCEHSRAGISCRAIFIQPEAR